MRKITAASRAAARRNKKARNKRNGIVCPPATKRELNKVSTGRPAPIARASATVTPLVIDPLARIRALPIEDINLGVRAYNPLKREGVDTVGQLIDLTEAELLAIKGIGQKIIDTDIVPKLAAFDSRLKLKDTPVPAMAA